MNTPLSGTAGQGFSRVLNSPCISRVTDVAHFAAYLVEARLKMERLWLAIEYGWHDCWDAFVSPDAYGYHIWSEGAMSHWHPRVQVAMDRIELQYLEWCYAHGG